MDQTNNSYPINRRAFQEGVSLSSVEIQAAKGKRCVPGNPLQTILFYFILTIYLSRIVIIADPLNNNLTA